MDELPPKRRDLIVKYLSDISKGALIAMFAGLATNKLKGLDAVVYFLTAMLTLTAAFFLEETDHDA